ncbi:response regulator receiver modulated diguanylate cyclase [Maridesulfovibrio ferrireducens]|uniref:diguanylate cyclase n=1 Tax=Maridesulfovibrio ferrireducens TaxID=246191 RepID=A0A1G9GTH6_9BACT|nr:diguanylate cyclase [Maridesulfovibrio ferrireducens]SDL03938.1 response regulator receiver modulated diguanylate cyclase [Maridesulfovibrio ferrireducens]
MAKKIIECSSRPMKVLIVEDSMTFSGILKRCIKSSLNVESLVFGDYASAEEFLNNNECEFFAALLDINLPDAPNGEIVDLVVSKNIPSIVFTGELSDDLRDIMWAKRIVDYVPKENFGNIEHVINLVDRLRKNINTKVLVVDDSSTSRNLCRALLDVCNFQVIEAVNGQEGLDLINSDNEIRLVIADHYMPIMDGLTLVKEIRRKFSKSALPIIGLSGVGGATTSAYFLKAGANDYIHKPFLVEEFYCRVSHNIENSEYISTIKEMSEIDYLTGICNRRSFFKFGEKLFSQQQRSGATMVAAMIDIDEFKNCNDTYGHIVGDEVIKDVADLLASRFRKGDVVSRYGGDEFCLLCADMKPEEIKHVFDSVKDDIDNKIIKVGEHEIFVTVSIGVCSTMMPSLDEMVLVADKMLYDAKDSGRNQVSYSD